MKRLGVIDIGTNSVKLLVAEANGSVPRVLRERVLITRLGAGLETRGGFDPRAMDRTMAAARRLAAEARRLGVDRVEAVGTAAFREAANRDLFCRRLRGAGLVMSVLSGRREAELAFEAATSGLTVDRRAAVVDVGGGSTEIAWEDGPRLRRLSLPLGAVRLTERHLTADPIRSTDFKAMIASIRRPLRRALAGSGSPPTGIVAVGGTAATLAAMQLGLRRYDAGRIHGLRLSRSQLYVLLVVLSMLSTRQRKALPGLEPKRADIIVAGTAVLAALLRTLRLSEVTVSARGLRYGILLERLEAGR